MVLTLWGCGGFWAGPAVGSSGWFQWSVAVPVYPTTPGDWGVGVEGNSGGVGASNETVSTD